MALTGKVRKQLKHSFDSIRNERLKHNLLQALPFWVGSLLTGLVAVFYAKIFALAEALSHKIFNYRVFELNKGLLFLLITPLCFVVARWVVIKFAPFSRGSGIPQVIAGLELANPKHNSKVDKLLSVPVIIVKIISSIVMVIGGAIVGREGPTIQISGSIFRLINNWLPKWWPKISKHNMISAGAAAGLAAAFNTPLGGIVFAVEELTKTHISYFKTSLFTAVIIAGLTAQYFMGPYLYLGVPVISSSTGWVFAIIALVAAIAGIFGSAMSKGILAIFAWKKGLKKNSQHVMFAVACGVVIAVMGIFLGESTLWSGKEIMTNALFTADKHVAWYLPLVRTVAPLLCFTTGGAGGVFAPALASGASIGALVSEWFHLTPGDTNLLILCGMVGFLTGVTRTPFTSAILVLEMTDRHNAIFYLMLAGMVASIVSVVVDKHSFYDHLKHQYIHELIKETKTPDAAETPAVEPGTEDVKHI